MILAFFKTSIATESVMGENMGGNGGMYNKIRSHCCAYSRVARSSYRCFRANQL